MNIGQLFSDMLDLLLGRVSRLPVKLQRVQTRFTDIQIDESLFAMRIDSQLRQQIVTVCLFTTLFCKGGESSSYLESQYFLPTAKIYTCLARAPTTLLRLL